MSTASTDSPVIRLATSADERTLSDLATRLADFELPAWRTAGEIARADARGMIAAVRARHPDDQVFVAERAGTPVGCLHILATADFFGRRHAHISVIATSAAAEGSGVGRSMMAFAEDWARKRQLTLLTLHVFANNTRARRFYEQAGMAPEFLKYAKPL
jgi:ribosomal protein S18 acetylase RimI-like enzyme